MTAQDFSNVSITAGRDGHARINFDGNHVSLPGVTPDQLARSRRTHFARRLIDDTNLTMTDIASTAGFGSVRQFNREMQQAFGAPPSAFRSESHPTTDTPGGGLTVEVELSSEPSTQLTRC